jgi:hypothetical protein
MKLSAAVSVAGDIAVLFEIVLKASGASNQVV